MLRNVTQVQHPPAQRYFKKRWIQNLIWRNDWTNVRREGEKKKQKQKDESARTFKSRFYLHHFSSTVNPASEEQSSSVLVTNPSHHQSTHPPTHKDTHIHTQTDNHGAHSDILILFSGRTGRKESREGFVFVFAKAGEPRPGDRDCPSSVPASKSRTAHVIYLICN